MQLCNVFGAVPDHLTLAYCPTQKKSRTDKNAKEVDPTTPAFTRRREVFAGRLAMAGFAASLIGEVGAVNPCAWSSVYRFSSMPPPVHSLRQEFASRMSCFVAVLLIRRLHL